jgi:hypothetical protein
MAPMAPGVTIGPFPLMEIPRMEIQVPEPPRLSSDWSSAGRAYAEMAKAWTGLEPLDFRYVFEQTDAQRAQAGADRARQRTQQMESLYDQGRSHIEENRYDRAIDSLDRVIVDGGSQAAAAMYWKAYSLAKLARRPDALTTLADLQKQFPRSPWVKDAQALDVEVRQASGQAVDADAQSTEELKLLALRGLMQSDPETALPVIEKMLSGSSSVRVKDQALFVVSQSRSARARTVIQGVAKGNPNPELQLRAIRYMGRMGGTESTQALDEVYRSASDDRVKREILRAFGAANARDKLLALAKGESSAELRGDAVRYLGNMNATAELEQLYRGEASLDVKRRILQSMQNQSGPETLTAIYAAEQSEDLKKAIIGALSNRNSATALVTLARAEKNAALKQEIVRRLGNMRTPEARDYLLELLK